MQSVGSLLKESAVLYRKEAKVILGYSAWLLLPYGALLLLGLSGNDTLFSLGSIVIGVVATLLWIWVSIILVRYISAIHGGTTPNLPKTQESATGLVLPLLWVGILQAGTFFGGILLFIIPAFVFMIWFAFAQLSVILDGQRGIEALKFSHGLVKGRFWKIAWRLLGGSILSVFLFSILLAAVLLLISQFTGAAMPDTFAAPTPTWMDVLGSVAEVFFVPYLLIYSTILYKAVKNDKTSSKHSEPV